MFLIFKSVINGKFNYQFKLKQPKFINFTLLRNNKEVVRLGFEDEKIKKGMFLGNFLIGNENITITYKEDKHKVNKDLPKNFHVAQIEGIEENRVYQKTFYKNLLNQNFIKENPNSYPLLWQMLEYSDKYSSSQLEDLSSGFSPELKKSTTFTILKKIISEKKDIEKYGFVKSFNWLDINGKGYQYNQVLEGKKRMLIIFWASWCVPCRKEIPALKEFYKKKKETSKIEFFYNENQKQLEKISVENSTLKTHNLELKQSQSDLDLVRKFLPMELQSLVVRARELASGGDSGGTKHTAEPTPTADLTTYKRPKYK